MTFPYFRPSRAAASSRSRVFRYSPKTVEPEPLNLEDLFVDYTAERGGAA